MVPPAEIEASSNGTVSWSAPLAVFPIKSFPTNFPCSFGFWIKVEHHINWEMLLMEISNAGGAYIDVRYQKNVGFTLYTSGGTASTFTRTINVNNWHHICFVYAGSSSRILYLDGVQIGSQTNFFSMINFNEIRHSNGFSEGSRGGRGTNGIHYAHFIAFDRALSAQEVFAFANNEQEALRYVYQNEMRERNALLKNPTVPIGTFSAAPKIQFVNDSPMYTSPQKILGQFSSRRRLFVVS